MICQGCGQEVEPNELHTYYDCLRWIRVHPEDEAKVTVKHLYYGASKNQKPTTGDKP